MILEPPVFNDVPISLAFVRFDEDGNPVAVVTATIDGKVLVTPFTGSLVYTEHLGGGTVLSGEATQPITNLEPKSEK